MTDGGKGRKMLYDVCSEKERLNQIETISFELQIIRLVKIEIGRSHKLSTKKCLSRKLNLFVLDMSYIVGAKLVMNPPNMF
mmetsp:Transcript_31782/g.36730  ORF Transcript_31782/g.36730 Transcript_31782/m.36730 type:complete len:81 (+) Transcript_31782:38-280(+)